MSGRPLRIALLAYRGNPHCGGQGVYLWFLARELARQGHTVDVFVGPPYPDPMPFVRECCKLPDDQFWSKWFLRDRRGLLPQPNPLRVFEPLRFYELAASWIGFLPEPFACSVRALRALAARLRAGRRYDLVHDVQCLGWGVLGLRALGLPVVATIHHPLTVDRRASFARDRTLLDAIGTMEFYPVGMQRFVARRLDRILTSSRASARLLVRDFAIDPARIRMVGNGVDTEFFAPARGVAREASRLLCVARAADPNKGVRTLLEALARLPREVSLTLVDDRSRLNPAWGWIDALGLRGRVTITGRVAPERLLDLYRRVALVAVPSLYEGFGLPAVEAMACETPVVASAAGALREVLACAPGGRLVPPGDPEALARAIGELLAAPEARARLGRRGRAGVVSEYGWPAVAERTVEVYREAVEEAYTRRGRPARTTTSAQRGRRDASASLPRSAA